MVWKSNVDCAECSDGVRLQHKTTSSLHAPPVGSAAHPPLNRHPSVLRSQVSSDIWRQPQQTDSKSILMSYLELGFYASPLLLYTNYFLSQTRTDPSHIPPNPNTPIPYMHTFLLSTVIKYGPAHYFDLTWKFHVPDLRQARLEL